MPNIKGYTERHCPDCNAIIRCYDTEGSEYYGCSTCHTFFRQKPGEQPAAIKTFNAQYNFIPALQIGDEGMLNGICFIVTGIIQKYEPKEGLYWTEYMLFNLEEDYYRVLAHVEREWYYIWLSEQQDFEVKNTNVNVAWYVAIEHNPYRKYDLYAHYTYDILYAVGEFDTDILADVFRLKVDEYTDADGILVCETDNGKSTWFRGYRLTPGEVKAAFNKEYGFHFKETPQDVFERRWPHVRNVALVLTGLVLLTHFLFLIFKPEKQLLKQGYAISTDVAAGYTIAPIDAGLIEVKGPTALNFIFSADIYNDWLEIGASLVNVKNGKTYELNKAIEYYAGFEGGERWSEGSKQIEAVLSNIPSGTYRLNVYPYANSPKYTMLSITVTEDTVLVSNLLLVLLLILIYPAFLYTRKYIQES